MGPPSDKDVMMGPPSGNTSSSLKEGTPLDVSENYKSLKRRFDEIEEDFKSGTYLQSPINGQIHDERDRILKRMREIEEEVLSIDSTLSYPRDITVVSTSVASATSSQIFPSTNSRQDTVSNKLSGSATRNGTSSAGAPLNGENGQIGNILDSGSLQTRVRLSSSTNFIGETSLPVNKTPSSASGSKGQTSSQMKQSLNGDIDAQMINIVNPARGDGQPLMQSTRNGSDTSPRRSTRQTRNTRLDNGNVIAAVAAATAEAEAAASRNIQDQSRGNVTQVPSLSSTLAYALGTNNVSSSKESSSSSIGSAQPLQMESILRVAQAAVAAQRAAATHTPTTTPITKPNGTSSNVDPNLDPSLYAESNNSVGDSPADTESSPTPPRPPTPTAPTSTSANTNAVASTSSTPTSSPTTTTTSTPTPSSSLSNNPYLTLSPNLLARMNGNSTSPSAHPMLMPYPWFYPPSTTPGAPSATPSPLYYNPYYYLAAAPMVPGANGMYTPPTNIPNPSQQQRSVVNEAPKAKAKRLKAHAVTTKSFSIPMVPRDKKGQPMLPLNVGIMTVISLGTVCMREHFHTERYIFPVGYEVTRRYLSTIDPTIEVVYHCTILDGGDGPKFQIIPSDRPDKPIIAGTATGAWSNIVKQANAIRNRQHSNSVSGPDFFGLGQNTIKHLIQELPNADRLRDYVWQNFQEGGPLGGRHAAVIPALPEEYDASLPLGAYYPKREGPIDPSVPRGLAHYPQHIIAQAEAERSQKMAAHVVQTSPQSVAGSSGSSSTPPEQQTTVPRQPTQPPSNIVSPNNDLHIREYHPPTPLHPSGQSTQPGDNRPTLSSTGGVANSVSSTDLPQSASGVSQHQSHSISQSTTVNGAISGLGTDGIMPTTFAGIMNAFSASGVPSTKPNPTPSGS